MAVVSRESSVAHLELRSAALTLIAVVLKTTDLDALARELEQRASVMPGLFDDEPVAIDLSRLRDDAAPIDFTALLALLRRHRMVPLAVRGGNDAQTADALAAGLVVAPEGARAARDMPPVERIVEVRVPPPPPLVVQRPLRSGQQVYAEGRDLIMLALVSHGAEVIADGHVHVYAPLRGRAIAGARGDTEARIFTTALQAQLLSIAGIHRTTESLPHGVAGRPAMAHLAGGELRIVALESGA
ncbi:MAG: septum site-determining protein MinC [Burkholderiaceae bacterium]